MALYNSYFQAQQQLAGIEAIDYFFAKEMLTALNKSRELTTPEEQLLHHVFFALSVSLRAGHSCLPLTALAQQHWGVAFDEQGECSNHGFIFPDKDFLFNALTQAKLTANADQPIVFENNNIYMRRYFQFEQTLVQNIKARLKLRLPTSLEVISSVLQQLFPPLDNVQTLDIDWQKLAVANAMNKNFTVIAGGPGTGKTYTVTKLLAALIMLQGNNNIETMSNNDQPLEIALVAPTG
jgi:exodeoxyribonuclease V alpha subunit